MFPQVCSKVFCQKAYFGYKNQLNCFHIKFLQKIGGIYVPKLYDTSSYILLHQTALNMQLCLKNQTTVVQFSRNLSYLLPNNLLDKYCKFGAKLCILVKMAAACCYCFLTPSELKLLSCSAQELRHCMAYKDSSILQPTHNLQMFSLNDISKFYESLTILKFWHIFNRKQSWIFNAVRCILKVTS